MRKFSFLAPSLIEVASKLTKLDRFFIPNSCLGFQAAIISAIHQQSNISTIIICPEHQDVENLFYDLQFYCHQTPTYFPEWEVLPTDNINPHVSIVSDRMKVLFELMLTTKPAIVCTTIKSFVYPTIHADVLKKKIFCIDIEKKYSMKKLVQILMEYGYERVAEVQNMGEFALRGGILDFWSIHENDGYRLDFFGDEIEMIKLFDPMTQRTTHKELNRCYLLPCNEWDLIQQDKGYLFQYLKQYRILLMKADEFKHQEYQLEQMDLANYEKLKFETFIHQKDSLVSIGAFSEVSSIPFDYPRINIKTQAPASLLMHPMIWSDEERIKTHLLHLQELCIKHHRCLLVVQNKTEEKRIQQLFKEYQLEVYPEILVGCLQNGFLAVDDDFIIISMRELFHKKSIKRIVKRTIQSLPIDFIHQLNEDDYVVHLNYGIAQYKGIEHLEDGDHSGEYLKLSFYGEQNLYVPVDQIGLVERYVGVQDQIPKKNKLGTNAWSQQKIKAQNAIHDMAAHLLEIQAQRKKIHAEKLIVEDDYLNQFEDEFPFEETIDQIKSIKDIKKDLTSVRPMDRLICGDVGFGKTEVAMRAAFCAVINNKQVAVLVPTTVLAYQHDIVFRERFAEFPVRVEMLSRFKTRKEQIQILEDLRLGKIDIIIGTHRLVSSDVYFKELGLVIIDEEQRFGVMQKEKLKRSKKNVHVLTMSATPIPRTLHMALNQIRDISLIQSPPSNRLPVETIVSSHNDLMIHEALVREKSRGGQVYWIHNRIYSIDRVREKILRLVPGLVVDVAHGQMGENQLEQIMQNFIMGNSDVLVCTNIVESGLDISNANTIIIEMADRFGLADLYQLRGRVGRTERRAYAYLFYSEDMVYNPDAKKRLKAIQDFTALGSGFQIALKDLEIRGAGNLLGKEQSGHIAAIGFKMYCDLLEKTIQNKGKPFSLSTEVSVLTDISLEISAQYIHEVELRLKIYRKISKITTSEDVKQIEQELKDRFGKIPDSVYNLIYLQRLKSLAADAQIDKIWIKNHQLVLFRRQKRIFQGSTEHLQKKHPRFFFKQLIEWIELQSN